MSFENWAISESLFNYLLEILPDGKTILELGSGDGTIELLKHWKVYSIESEEEWVDKYHSNYIYAPLVKHKEVNHYSGNVWYNARVLEQELPKIDYDLILVDGPHVSEYRTGLIKYWDLFKHDVPIVFDDVHRVHDWKVMRGIAARLRKPYIVPTPWEGKQWGVVL